MSHSRHVHHTGIGSQQSHSACTDKFQDPERTHHVDKGFDLAFLACQFHHDVSRTHIDDLPAEDLDQFPDFAALSVSRADLDQHQVPFDILLIREVQDLHDRDDLLQLLAYLIQDAIIATDDKRDA